MPSLLNGGPSSDDAPWVFVTSKKSNQRGRRRPPDAFKFHSSSLSNTAAVPPTCKTSASAALSHIQADHARITAWWCSQPSYQHLKTLISDYASSHAIVTQAVCLGAGSFGGPLDGGEAFRRAHLQTAAFLLIVDLLRQGGSPIPCYFQEPMYTDADKHYIHSLGHTVVETPAGSHMITSTSMVFAVHFPLREYLDCLSGALPAMLVGTGYSICEGLPQFSPSNESALRPLRVVNDAFDAYEFPQEKNDYCFSDTLIYWHPRKHESIS